MLCCLKTPNSFGLVLRLRRWDTSCRRPPSASTTPTVSCTPWVLACQPRTPTISGVDTRIFVLKAVPALRAVKSQLVWNYIERNDNRGSLTCMDGGNDARIHPGLPTLRLCSHLSDETVTFHSSVTLPFSRRFLYEGHQDFSCLPTFGVILSQAAMMDGGLSSVPGLQIDFTQVRNMPGPI